MEGLKSEKNIENVYKDLKTQFNQVSFDNNIEEVHWFPQTDEEITLIAKDLLLACDPENNKDHPHF